MSVVAAKDHQGKECTDGGKTVFNMGKDCPETDCRNIGFEYAEIGIPVELRPKSGVGRAETECVGMPEVTCERGASGEVCHIVITQKVKVKIPFHVGVQAKAGNDFIKCACRDKPKDDPHGDFCGCHKDD